MYAQLSGRYSVTMVTAICYDQMKFDACIIVDSLASQTHFSFVWAVEKMSLARETI